MITPLLLELQPIMIISPVANFGNHPLFRKVRHPKFTISKLKKLKYGNLVLLFFMETSYKYRVILFLLKKFDAIPHSKMKKII